LDDNPFEFEGVRLSHFQNQYTPDKPSYGLMINEHLLFSGDTRPIRQLCVFWL